jgi:hypothetical protein
MDNVSETQAAAFAPACVKLPTWDACLPAADTGRSTRVQVANRRPESGEGTGMPAVSLAHAQQSIRKPDNFTTRIYALSGGGLGPHPAREPEPV